jgi:VanZ family protein
VTVLLSLYVLFWPSSAGSDVRIPGADKLVHAGLFLLLAVTARLRFGALPRVLAAVLVYAALSELVQALLLVQRSGDLLDLVADAAGATAGWLLVARAARGRSGAPREAGGDAGPKR